MRGDAPISSVYRMGERPTAEDPIEAFCRLDRMRRAAWRNAGIISVQLSELPTELRDMMQKWAEDNYGRR